MRDAVRRHEPFAVSAITLLEIAVLFGTGTTQSGIALDKILEELNSNPDFRIIPFTVDIAAEVAAVGPSLRDPSDRAIVSTARVEKLKLVTSDQRIIDSGLVPVVV